MSAINSPGGSSGDSLLETLQRYWGYDSFLPLQREAMDCVLAGHDSVVVLPTGGGKSLCFQAPAMCLPGLAVVVSPLIALMKDQVDGLRNCGVPAAFANSTLSRAERRSLAGDVRAGRLRLLYLAPERLLADGTLEFLKTANVSLVAIDEAHCISSWGHDFRPEYRGLRALKEAFPKAGVHAYTATASEQVRRDIAEQLQLTEPEILVGRFDRPNLIYKVQRRANRLNQIQEVLGRHAGESGIIYCITRKDVDQTTAALQEVGHRALPYHAGLSDEERRRNQEAFIEDQADTIVATVAFGMGIDKSNVRYVIHAGMPKSLEHYQQESGRAGRDGMEAECCLFFSGQDYGVWKRMLEDSEPAAREGAMRSLSAMMDFCNGVQCRHRTIVEYFGQQFDDASCGACDVCLGQLDLVDDPLVTAQKILSCVLRLQQRFGADYTAKVLHGSEEQRIVEQRHHQLSTWGLLSGENLRTIRDWIEQLVSQDFLAKAGDYHVLEVTAAGRRLLRGEATPRLLRPARAGKATKAVAAESWEGVDRGLFDELRRLRHETAAVQNVPAYIVFSDATLRHIARRRPSTLETFRQVSGVGEKKLADYGRAFVERVVAYCSGNGLSMDIAPPDVAPAASLESGPRMAATRAFGYFREGRSVSEVAEQMGRATSTAYGYLADFIRNERVTDPSPWVDGPAADRIAQAARQVGLDRLKPIFECLGGEIGYEQIRIVVLCLQNKS
ncbi:MAG: DNA helicase RecQ [Rhodopirellula sp.]|nr:DNA helicase RecQ [Rhodopirellula sp.]